MHERDRFDKFNEQARRVMSLAQQEAQRFNHSYIGTEHILLGLVRESEGVASEVLSVLQVERLKVRTLVEQIVGRGDRIVMNEIGLTPRGKKVIELAGDEARRLNDQYIGTEHLLLGLVREGEGIAAGVLKSLGVNHERVRTTILVLRTNKGRNLDWASARSTINVPGWLSAYSTGASGGPTLMNGGVTSTSMREMAVRLRAEADRLEGMAQVLDLFTQPPSASTP